MEGVQRRTELCAQHERQTSTGKHGVMSRGSMTPETGTGRTTESTREPRHTQNGGLARNAHEAKTMMLNAICVTRQRVEDCSKHPGCGGDAQHLDRNLLKNKSGRKPQNRVTPRALGNGVDLDRSFDKHAGCQCL